MPPCKIPDGPIAEIDQLIEYYNHSKSGAFSTNLLVFIKKVPTPPPRSKKDPPGKILGGPIAEIDQLIEYYNHNKFGAFNLKCTIISPFPPTIYIRFPRNIY